MTRARSDERTIEVDTTAGRVRGRRREDGSHVFLGIPFAEPPVGPLRFGAPVPHAPWSGVRDALEHGATAQRKLDTGVTLIPEPSIPGESTLNVDVFTPEPSRAAALPVLVYLHGGGYLAGSPASPWYDGAAFNRDGVVTVNLSYRLGFDGFGWIEDAPANRGVLDWLLALEWVRDNIVSFGGDPGRVTIAGQSAGGGAVLTLLGMPRARGLFHGAYAMSAALADVPAERAETIGRRVAELGGVEPTRASLGGLDEARVAELAGQAITAAPGDRLAELRSLLDDGLPLGPMIDGELVIRPTLEAIAAGSGADVPLVLGTNDDELSAALDSVRRRLRWIPAGALLRRLGVPRETRSAYLADNRGLARHGGTAAVVGRYASDRVFRSLALRVAEARATSPTWLYRFSWGSPATGGRAVHCLDVPFFFDCLGAERVTAVAGPRPPASLAGAVHADAVTFVQTGDPGWRRFTRRDADAEVFDVPLPTTLPDAYASVRSLV